MGTLSDSGRNRVPACLASASSSAPSTPCHAHVRRCLRHARGLHVHLVHAVRCTVRPQVRFAPLLFVRVASAPRRTHLSWVRPPESPPPTPCSTGARRDARPRGHDGEFLLHVEGHHSLDQVWHMHMCTPRLRKASDVRACVFASRIGARRNKQVHVLDCRVCAWRGPSDEHADVTCIDGCCDVRRDERISHPISNIVHASHTRSGLHPPKRKIESGERENGSNGPPSSRVRPRGPS